MSTESECHKYGSTRGCDEGCPVLMAGECANMLEVLHNCNISSQAKMELHIARANHNLNVKKNLLDLKRAQIAKTKHVDTDEQYTF